MYEFNCNENCNVNVNVVSFILQLDSSLEQGMLTYVTEDYTGTDKLAVHWDTVQIQVITI